jgi:hypothetical protein
MQVVVAEQEEKQIVLLVERVVLAEVELVLVLT